MNKRDQRQDAPADPGRRVIFKAAGLAVAGAALHGGVSAAEASAAAANEAGTAKPRARRHVVFCARMR